MPELPDLEVIKENLAPRLLGRGVERVEVFRPGLVKTRAADLFSLEGMVVGGLGRRGKHLFLSFVQGPHLILHLMRYGWLWHGPSHYSPTKSTTLRISFNDDNDLRLIEPGKPQIAAAWLVENLEDAEPFDGLGPEPLDPSFTLELWRSQVAGKRRQLKKLLTDQGIVAGIGNAYADEILFRAGLSPFRYAHTLSAEELARLWQTIPETLGWAISQIRARVGNELFDKEVRDFLYVHGRAGQPCRVCGTPIAEVTFDDQRTDFCPRCQHANEPILH